MPSVPFWCCCNPCPGPALQVTLSGVTTTPAQVDFSSWSVDLSGAFENGVFRLPRFTTGGYWLRPGTLASLGQFIPLPTTCNFSAFRSDYGPLKVDLLGEGDDPETREFSYCNRSLSVRVIKDPTPEAPNRYWLLIDVDTSLPRSTVPEIDTSGQLGRVFEASFEWDGTGTITGIANATTSDFFSGGTASITVTSDTTTLIPGDSEDDCPLYTYVVRPVIATVYCDPPGAEDGTWTQTQYRADDNNLYPLTFRAGTCEQAEHMARLRIAAVAAGTGEDWGLNLNAGWQPSGGTGLGGDYVYYLGYCLEDGEADPFDGNHGAWWEYPGGVGNTVEGAPYFAQYGYAPHERCNEGTADTHYFFHYLARTNCETGDTPSVILTSIFCERWMPPDGTPTLGTWLPVGTAPFAVWERWEMGDVCVGPDDVIDLPDPPDPPDALAVIEFCTGADCTNCGDCYFADGSTADFNGVSKSDFLSTRLLITGMTFDPETCRFTGTGTRSNYFSPDGSGEPFSTEPATESIYFSGGQWYFADGTPIAPGDCSGSSYTSTSTDVTIVIHSNPCEPDDAP